MIPLQILPYKKFYKVIIDDLTENETSQHYSQISKIWHVEVSKKASTPYMSCRVETFRREHEDNIMLQSEKDLWRRLALINDDISFLLDTSGQMTGIKNQKELTKKSKNICASIREMYKGHLIDKLLTKTENLYENSLHILQEFDQYKHVGLLFPGLYDNESDTHARNYLLNVPEDPSKIEIHEKFLRAKIENGQIHIKMKGEIKMPSEDMPLLETYKGEFIVETQSTAILQAKIETAFSGQGYRVRRKYELNALSENDIKYI